MKPNSHVFTGRSSFRANNPQQCCHRYKPFHSLAESNRPKFCHDENKLEFQSKQSSASLGPVQCQVIRSLFEMIVQYY